MQVVRKVGKLYNFARLASMVNVIVVEVLLIRPEGIVFKEQSPTICTTSNAKCYALSCIGNSCVSSNKKGLPPKERNECFLKDGRLKIEIIEFAQGKRTRITTHTWTRFQSSFCCRYHDVRGSGSHSRITSCSLTDLLPLSPENPFEVQLNIAKFNIAGKLIWTHNEKKGRMILELLTFSYLLL